MRRKYVFPLLITAGIVVFALAILPLTASALAN